MLRKRNPGLRKSDVDSLPLLGKESGKSDHGLESFQSQKWHEIIDDERAAKINLKIKPTQTPKQEKAKNEKITIGLKVNDRRPLLVTHQYPSSNSNSKNSFPLTKPIVTIDQKSPRKKLSNKSTINFNQGFMLRDTLPYAEKQRTTKDKMHSCHRGEIKMEDKATKTYDINKGDDVSKEGCNQIVDTFTNSFSEPGSGSGDDICWEIIKKQASSNEDQGCETNEMENDAAYNDYIAEAVSIRLKLEKANSLSKSRSSSSSIVSTMSSSESRSDSDTKSPSTIDRDVAIERTTNVPTQSMSHEMCPKKSKEMVSELPISSKTTKLNVPKIVTNNVQDSSLKSKQKQKIPNQKHYPKLQNISKLESHLNFNSKELSILRKSSSETSHLGYENTVKSLVSICLLELNGKKMNASSRLKNGLYAGSYMMKEQCELTDDKKMFQIILENIDEGEDNCLWRVSASFSTERKEQYSKSNSFGRNAKSHLTKLLQVRTMKYYIIDTSYTLYFCSIVLTLFIFHPSDLEW